MSRPALPRTSSARTSSARTSWAGISSVTVSLFVALVLAVSGVAGCSTRSEPKTTAPKPSPTPIAKLNTGAMKLVRGEFCPLLSTGTVSAALDGKSTSARSWRDGDKAVVEGGAAVGGGVEDGAGSGVGAGLDDVVHEYGCRWTRSDAGGTTTASAWLFARTLNRKDARAVIAADRKQPGCRATPGPGFGSPSRTQLCTTGGVRRGRVAGLFGDSWLTCQVSAPTSVSAPLLTRRTDTWCVDVANATNTTR